MFPAFFYLMFASNAIRIGFFDKQTDTHSLAHTQSITLVVRTTYFQYIFSTVLCSHKFIFEVLCCVLPQCSFKDGNVSHIRLFSIPWCLKRIHGFVLYVMGKNKWYSETAKDVNSNIPIVWEMTPYIVLLLKFKEK